MNQEKSWAEPNSFCNLVILTMEHLLFLLSNFSALKMENQTKENKGLNWALKIRRI
jgi:hypothetical protein